MQTTLPEDPCANHHGGNTNSWAAWEQTLNNLPAKRRVVLTTIQAAGRNGLTCLECAEKLSTYPNRISGRFTELKAAGLIIDTKLVRAGSTVWISA